jgi:hypothetical protein
MSTGNERELRDRLDGALGTLTPGRPPVESVIRRGRGIRMRRRAGVAAGLAVIVAAAVALPGLLRQAAHPPEPAQPSYHMTVSPPPRGAPAGEIATGTINGRDWTVIYGVDNGHITVHAPHLVFREPDVSPGSDHPAVLAGASAGKWQLLAGPVAPNVTRLAVTVPRGPVLDLTPVTWHGRRWAAIMVPAQLPIRRVTAYSRHGELRYAIPFQNSVIGWLKPGQRGPRRVSVTLASGTVLGHRWVARGYLGPWGVCMTNGTGSLCTEDVSGASAAATGKVVSQWTCGDFQGARDSVNVAAPQVRTVRLRLSDGSTRVARTVALGPLRAFAFLAGHGLRVTGWSAFGAAGQQIGAGLPAGWGCNS